MLNHALDGLFFHLKVKEFWCDFVFVQFDFRFCLSNFQKETKTKISFSEINGFFSFMFYYFDVCDES